MPITDRKRAELARNWGITLRERRDWPDSFCDLFVSVKKLGNATYPFHDDRRGARYHRDHDSSHAVQDRDAVEERKQRRVKDLTSEARFLRDHMYDKGETDWRIKIEEPLFKHFEKDVLW